MDSLFFRVEHDLLRSESFKALGGSAIKVYLVIGLYSDFGTGWAYPSIRTIAKQAGLSRQTVLAAIENLTQAGLLAANKSRGRSTAYKVMREAPERPSPRKSKAPNPGPPTGPLSLEVGGETGPESLPDPFPTVPKSYAALAQFLGPGGPGGRPKQEPGTREETNTIPIPGTPFRLSADGRLQVPANPQQQEDALPRRVGTEFPESGCWCCLLSFLVLVWAYPRGRLGRRTGPAPRKILDRWRGRGLKILGRFGALPLKILDR